MGRHAIDIIGHRFGRLVVLHRDETFPRGEHISSRWIVKCDCGSIGTARSDVLRGNNKLSCGCLKKILPKFTAKYGIPKSAFQRWANMMRRCYSPKSEKDEKNYLLRGIVVCERWHNPVMFYQDIGDPPFIDASIDRIDNNGNYEPSNVRWATRSQQNRNRRKFTRSGDH